MWEVMTDQQRNYLYSQLGTRIRQEREKQKLSQGKLAGLIPISRVSIVNIEKGQQHTPLHVLVAIARALHTDLQSLLPDLEEVYAGRKPDLPPARLTAIEERVGSDASKRLLISFVNEVTSGTNKGKKQ
jgi:DNA-binding XRE family transcriptional regulator